MSTLKEIGRHFLFLNRERKKPCSNNMKINANNEIEMRIHKKNFFNQEKCSSVIEVMDDGRD